MAPAAYAGPQSIQAAASSLSTALTAETLSILLRIELVLEKIVDAIAREDPELYIELKMRPSTTTDTAEQRTIHRKIKFPGKTPREAWRFSTVCF